jgi:hypothetical protein
MAKRRNEAKAVSAEDFEKVQRQLAEMAKLLQRRGLPGSVVQDKLQRARRDAEADAIENPSMPSNKGGRPPFDPLDVRTDRLGFRCHPDLRVEVERAARDDGMRISMWMERALIQAVNDRRGHKVLDLIGRRIADQGR